MKSPRPLKPVYTLNSLSNYGDAVALADMIQTFWREKGHTSVNVWVERNDNPVHPHFSIRSNLVNGLPPVAVKAAKAA